MQKEFIRILHLSDFHTGKDEYGQRMLFKYIRDHVESRVHEKRGPDLVVVTGDIADKGQSDHYERFAKEFLNPLTQILGTDSRGRVLIVPGNHDVNRREARYVPMHELLSKDPTVLDPDESGRSNRRQFWDRFRNFVTFDAARPDLDNHWLFSSHGVSGESRDIRGCQIGILTLNTAWLSYDENDRHKLSPGKGMVETGLARLNQAHVRIVLGHHPLDWFLDKVAQPLKVLFARNKVLYFHGHLHKNDGRKDAAENRNYLVFQAGAGFQEREDDDWKNGFQWYEIDIERHILLAEPLVWSAAHHEFQIDSHAYPNAYKSRHVTDRWEFDLPGSPQGPSGNGRSEISYHLSQQSVIHVADDAARALEVTDNYVKEVHSRCIGKIVIQRQEIQKIVDKLSDSQGSDAILLLGGSGYGKSVVLSRVAERMRADGWSVLAFSLDRPTLADTPQAFGSQLELSGSPVEVLARCTEGEKALLVIDQLDSATRTSGRNPGIMDCLSQILRQASVDPRINVLMACRESDYRDDHQFRDLIRGAIQTDEISLTALDEETAKPVICSLGIDTEQLSPSQLRLLSVPVHIKLLEMCLAANLSAELNFHTSKDLYDRLWDDKQLAIRVRLGRDIRWTEIVDRLTERMNDSQELSVPTEMLDDFGQEATLMASEGILILQKRRYSFFHESFFDYAFARRFVGRNRNISELLGGQGDEVFRRYQLRYFLSYERPDHKQRYLVDLEEALRVSAGRSLIQEVILDFLKELDDPCLEEWRIIDRWIGASSTESTASAVSRIFKVAYGSAPWFNLLLDNGFLTQSLLSDRADLVNLGLGLVEGVQKKLPEVVADMLEPFETVSDEWRQRIIGLMQTSEWGGSRRFFDLLLRLLEKGAMDPILATQRDHNFLWSLVWNIGKRKPEWSAELIGRYMRHRFEICRSRESADPFSGEPADIPDNQWGHKLILDCAGRSPEAFVEHVLPVMKSIIEGNLLKDENGLRCDRVWDHREFGETYEIPAAVLRGMEHAICRLSSGSPEAIGSTLNDFRESEHETLHYLLIRAYKANGQHFSNPAADYLLESPTRFRIGYVQSQYWAARELLEAITPHCCDERIVGLEDSILNYTLPSGERYVDRRVARDCARLTLLQGILRDRLSGKALDRLRLLEDEFSDHLPKPPPKRATAAVISPIPKSEAKMMSDEQWLGAIRKYRDNGARQRTEKGWIGGAYQLSRVLEEETKADPTRFARLLLNFSEDINVWYFEAVLSGIAGKEIETDLLNRVLECCHNLNGRPLGRSICYILERTAASDLPEPILDMVAWYATSDNDPDTADSIGPGKCIVTEGLDSVRGSAAIAMGNLIQVHGAVPDLVWEALGRMVRDPSVAVRGCVARTLCSLYLHYSQRAVELFMDLCEAPDVLLATSYVRRFIRKALPEFFTEMQGLLRRMMESQDCEVVMAASYDITMASFGLEAILPLAEECATGCTALRLGATQAHAEAVGITAARSRSEAMLRRLFSDPCVEVREAASACFYHIPEGQLHPYVGFVQAFIESPAFRDFHSGLIHYLYRIKSPLPDIVLDVATAFLDCVGTQAADIRTSAGGDGDFVQSLIFRLRKEASDTSVKQRCDALISRMLEMNVCGVRKNLRRLDKEKGS